MFVENPTYFVATKIFLKDAEFKVKAGIVIFANPSCTPLSLHVVTAVAMDDNGIIPAELEKVIEANKDYRPRELTERKPYWGILYCLANFHNPRGMCLPPGGPKQALSKECCSVVLYRSLQESD